MHKDTSPEERLLALIKGRHKKPKDKGIRDTALDESRQNANEMPEATQPEPKRAGSKSYILEILRFPLFKKRLFDPVVLRIINKYLAIIFILSIGYLFFALLFIKPNKNFQLLISQMPRQKSTLREAEEVVLDTKDYASYSSEISGKRLFSPTIEENITASPKGTQTPEEDMSGNLILVGIIQGDNPQAVIEDKKGQKTYYLSVNQSFNGFTIEEITAGKVILDYGGRKITLVL